MVQPIIKHMVCNVWQIGSAQKEKQIMIVMIW